MLISSAYAQAAAGAPDAAGSMMQFLPIVLMFVVLWFLMIRPQQKRAKEHQAMLDALAKGDEVVTGGGIAGRVVKIGESYVAVEIAEGVEIQVQKPAIALVLPKGTLKSL
ncbi:preprotein translocase subunit YajC [Azospira restricta]|uniref:Sec translocon accessory complex subunit YajC n=1 Tax=Azospira restricta TaxID=404405 RepID=A0A974Y5F4_9RHOO|nr:preprotein translocase subunit YajC [Azospira restricta]QRJ65300.1 preprotein translocase subunit YajC [Azospira restricta]